MNGGLKFSVKREYVEAACLRSASRMCRVFSDLSLTYAKSARLTPAHAQKSMTREAGAQKPQSVQMRYTFGVLNLDDWNVV